ncbi:MAG: ABC transporter permease [Peptostreptococcaceae bacterium]|nr:ABC transporter permease [Peptostreptococcaceae bacterium]
MSKKKIILLTVLAIVLISFPFLKQGYQDAIKTDVANTFAQPSMQHYFGTDHLGRDVYSLMVDGAMRTVATILLASGISLFFGLILGAMGAYYGGFFETAVQFLTDIFMIVPSFILALIISAMMGLNPVSAGITLGISGIGDYANQAMILSKSIKRRGFVQNGQSMGLGSLHIIFRHIIPHILSPILASLGNRASGIVLQYASLSFIGLGADLTKPDWGMMLYQYRIYIIDRPQLLFFPTFAIFVLAFSFYFVFDEQEI